MAGGAGAAARGVERRARQNWQEWEIPRSLTPTLSRGESEGPGERREGEGKEADAGRLLAQWWEKRIARQKEIDASIAAKAEVEYLYDKPYRTTFPCAWPAPSPSRRSRRTVCSPSLTTTSCAIHWRLSKDKAQDAAKRALDAIRYDGSEYLWINDYDTRMVMHPFKPELQGRDMSDTKDKSGKFLFTELVRVAKTQGAGFVEYFWPRPGSDHAVPKLSYVKGYEPWGWILGSGIDTDDVGKIVRTNALLAAGFVGIILLVVGGASMLIARGIVRPLAEMTATMRRLAEGDVTVQVPVIGLTNEVGQMASTVQVFKRNAEDRMRLQAEQEQLKRQAEQERKEMIVRIADKFETDVDSVAQALSASASQMQSTSQSMSATAEEASGQASAVAAASEQASSNVQNG